VTGSSGYSAPAVAGSGAIALGLAASATTLGAVRLLARSEGSAEKATAKAAKLCGKIDGADESRLEVLTEVGALADCDLIVEAIVEDREAKLELYVRLAAACPNADLATTTSSLLIADLGEAAGVADRFYGLHVFNPVAKMELVELCIPAALRDGAADRARAFCAALGKRAIEVPDQTGFVVNRLLFPYLFDAVRLQESSGMTAEDVDACMSLGAGHPMGPLALIDFVGLDVAIAIGESLAAESGDPAHQPPPRLRELAAEGTLGRKSGAGFFNY